MDLRPFKPGEFIRNDDGSISTQRTHTVQDANGKWINVPSLWTDKNGAVSDLSGDEDAIAEIANIYEKQNGKKFQRFDDLNKAVDAAVNKSHNYGAYSEASKGLFATASPSTAPNFGIGLLSAGFDPTISGYSKELTNPAAYGLLSSVNTAKK